VVKEREKRASLVLWELAPKITARRLAVVAAGIEECVVVATAATAVPVVIAVLVGIK
jgi:hypothetical protein